MPLRLPDIHQTSIDQCSKSCAPKDDNRALLSTVLAAGIAAMGVIGCHHSHAHDAHDVHIIIAGGPAFSQENLGISGGIEVAGHPAGEGINGNSLELAGEVEATYNIEGPEQGVTHVVGKVMLGANFDRKYFEIALTPGIGAGVETDWAFNTEPIGLIVLEGAILLGRKKLPVRPVLKVEAEGHIKFDPTPVIGDTHIAVKTGIAF